MWNLPKPIIQHINRHNENFHRMMRMTKQEWPVISAKIDRATLPKPLSIYHTIRILVPRVCPIILLTIVLTMELTQLLCPMKEYPTLVKAFSYYLGNKLHYNFKRWQKVQCSHMQSGPPTVTTPLNIGTCCARTSPFFHDIYIAILWWGMKNGFWQGRIQSILQCTYNFNRKMITIIKTINSSSGWTKPPGQASIHNHDQSLVYY